jgi:Heparinase II/III-like protein
VLLDPPEHNRWPALLALAAALFGRLSWWPDTAQDAGSVLAGALAGPGRQVAGRPEQRPSRFPDAGITILRTEPAGSPEIWCRCDGGPHGFLSIAAHAHADALSVEVRHGGVDILADPGTYCYHGEQEWRSYFRSTIGHNTMELGGRSQSVEAGPFMWRSQARAREIDASDDTWIAEHDGYATLKLSARHRRSVNLNRAERSVVITDVIIGDAQDVRLAFHLGPDVGAELADAGPEGACAFLRWDSGSGPAAARLELPAELRWTMHRGETGPILGWYSAGLGQRVPSVTFLGQGRCAAGAPLITRLKFVENEMLSDSSASWRAVSLTGAEVRPGKAPEIEAEVR